MLVYMLKTWLLALVLIAALTAGCIGGDKDVEPVEGTTDDGTDPGDGPAPKTPEAPRYKLAETTSIEKQLSAIEVVAPDDPEWDSPNITRRDWGLLTVPLTPEGSVSAFAWQVPRDTIIRNEGSDVPMVMFDFAVTLVPMGTPAGLPAGTDFALFIVHEKPGDGNLAVAHLIHRVTTEIQQQEAGSGLGSPSTVPAASDPFSARVLYHQSAEGVQPGDTIYFILAARGSSPSEFGLAFRPLGQTSATLPEGDSPTEDWEDFRNLVGENRAPVVPLRVGTGSGLHIATYLERHQAGSSLIRLGGDAVVDAQYLPSLYPSSTAGVITIESTTGTGGWSHAQGSYVSAADTGSWSADIDLHGTTAGVDGAFLNMQEEIAGISISGPPNPNFYGRAEGSSPASVTFSLSKTGRTLATETLQFTHISIGAQLSELVGLPFPSVAGASGGLGDG